MVWNSSELSLDLRPPVPSRDFLTPLPVAGNSDSDDLNKLDDFVNGLENELSKIQAFKRELPLSVLLLNDAIEKLKEEAVKRRDGKLDESIGAKSGNDQREKKLWMSSAQLWSPRSEGERGAFLSFGEEGSGIPETEEDDDAIPGLSLLTPGFNSVEPGSRGGVSTGPAFYSPGDEPLFHQTARKQRRCWSPDLHRRFVDALGKLGGSQVATPKQIKELMQVDGLTNDEVKSHLQKYRLHVRKLSCSGRSPPFLNDASTCKNQVHDLGCSKGGLTHTSSPQGPLNVARSDKCNSSNMEEDEHEEKSDGHSGKGEHHI